MILQAGSGDVTSEVAGGRRSAKSVAASVAALLLATATVLLVPGAAARAATAPGTVFVVHGIAGATLDVFLDGKNVCPTAAVKTVVGPLKLAPGSHVVALRDGATTIAQERFSVRSGQAEDVVAHRLSDAKREPTLTAYRDNLTPVPPGKVRLVVAHTAVAPPADIKVDGKVLFQNVANGESFTVLVPAGTYRVEIVPSATGGAPILGPVNLTLKAGTLTRVFAIGDSTKGTMDAVVHTVPVAVKGAAAPSSVHTGDGGQAAREFVDDNRPGTTSLVAAGALALALFAGGFGLLRHRTRSRLQA